MVNGQNTIDAMAIGRNKANEILALRQAARERRMKALSINPKRLELNTQVATLAGPIASGSFQTAGFLVAAGDSWFDYPFHDVLKLLDDNHGYNVESAAHQGDPIEAIAYEGVQVDKLARCLEKVSAQGAIPKAVLLSGGGDDIAGNEFGMLLNNALSNISGWNVDMVRGLLNQRITFAYRSMLTSIMQVCQTCIHTILPIIVHGYDYPVPDGRGFWGGWPFPGPWLEPGFREKQFTDLAKNVDLMRTLIDEFNSILAELVKDPTLKDVHYLDLRGTLSTVLADDAYQVWWENELHPTKRGFSVIADKFAAELAKL